MAALQSPFVNETKNLYSLVKKIVAIEYPPIPSNLYSGEKQCRKMTEGCTTSRWKWIAQGYLRNVQQGRYCYSCCINICNLQ
uniref:Protein containing PKc-like domain n=1 Tax=Rhipicephalus zambeziensis TaxID=60191 RepID=A0A224YYV1_9ACAR